MTHPGQSERLAGHFHGKNVALKKRNIDPGLSRPPTPAAADSGRREFSTVWMMPARNLSSAWLPRGRQTQAVRDVPL